MSDAIVPKGQPIPGDPEKKGWLFKWTNYLKGYQRRWFVLSNGLLSYYRNQAEMAHTCRGTISLLGALIHTADSCTFVISNGGTQTFHIRAHDEVERQSWVTALELAKAKAIRAQESDDDEEQMARGAACMPREDGEDAGGIARELAARFHDLRTCSELVARHGAALQRSLVDLEIPPTDNAKQVSERATLFRISCNAMMNACSEFMSAAAASSARMSRALQHEREQKMRLQEVVEQLARQHDNLEKTVTGRGTPHAGGNGATQGHETEDEDHEFFDAVEEDISAIMEDDDNTAFVIKLPVKRTSKKTADSDESEGEVITETQQVVFVKDKEQPEGSMGGATSVVAGGAAVVAAGGAAVAVAGSAKATGTGGAKATGAGSATTTGARESATTTSAGSATAVVAGSATVATAEGATAVGARSVTMTGAGCPAATTVTREVKIYPHATQVVSMVDGHPRRTRVPDRPNYPLSLWSIMKNCVGKELSKIPIPVNFSEPLSMLQRLTEEYEYSSILDQAAQLTDPAQQLAYVAAFTVSSYATTSVRTNKPFNPLLGETYECDRMADLGWRSISEQVSHHPPIAAQWCEGATGWQCWQEFTMTTKFRGKYLQIIPLGGASCEFPASGNKYTWRKVVHHPPTAVSYCEGAQGWVSDQEMILSSHFRGQYIAIIPNGDRHIIFRDGNSYCYNKVTTTVHNIIVGKLWVDNHGDMDIRGESGKAAGYVAHLKYVPYGYFSKDTQRKVTGVIKDPLGVPRYVLQGYWDSRVEVAPVTSSTEDNTQCKTGKFTVAWQRVPEAPDADKWYNFTLLAAQLNEIEKGVAPTDSRLRPDQRLMEEALWDEANQEKLRLEDRQRVRRREQEAAAEEAAAEGMPAPEGPKPTWFTREAVAKPGDPLRHLYNHRYWDCKARKDWSDCPAIF